MRVCYGLVHAILKAVVHDGMYVVLHLSKGGMHDGMHVVP